MKMPANKVTGVAALLALGVGVWLVPSESAAYCLSTMPYLDGLGGPIPVRINFGYYGRGARFVGLTASPGSCSSLEQIACNDTEVILVEWVKAAIDEFNMASHGGPKLYFAGFTQPPSPNWSAYQDGITIESFSTCAAQNALQPASPRQAYFALHYNNGGTKSRIQLIRGGPKACDGEGDHEPLKNYYWWVDPADDDGNKYNNHDLLGVLVHEIGHSLGLDHPDDANVMGFNCLGLDSGAAEASVMHYRDKDFRRRLRRDDIEGLRAIWGAPERSLYAAKNTTTGASAGSWGAQTQVGSLTVNTPPTLSDAARSGEINLNMATTDATDRVMYFVGSSNSILTSPNYVKSGTGTTGVDVRTYDPVGIARGRRMSDNQLRLAVAWLGDRDSPAELESKDPDDPDNRVWWKVWSSPTGWLTPKYSGLTKYKELGISYDPATDLFVLAHIDTCSGVETCPAPDPAFEYPGDSWVYVRTISGATGNHVCAQALTTAEHVLHVGSPACQVRTGLPTRCHIPVVTSDIAGPTLRVLEGTVDLHPEYLVNCWLRDAEPNPPPLTTSEASFGPLWMAMDGATLNGVALVSHVPGLSTTTPADDDYAELIVMARDGNGLLTGSIAQRVRMQSNYWPVAVGSLSRTTAPNTVWWAVTGY